jgi:Fic family protein
MKSFNPKLLTGLKLPVSTTCLIGQCMEARGKQDLWLKTKPEVMNALKDLAIIQSAESSNRIEGVTVDSKRLKPLLEGKVKPQDRSEEEVLGYRKALDWIHKRYPKVRVEPELALKLHSMAQGGFSGDSGRWKERDNEIIEVAADGQRGIRFIPVPAKETPSAMKQLCLAYSDFSDQGSLPDLLSIASFIFDFLCIHPFRDGNGRVSRLLSLLLLYQNGYMVGRYVSLERIIEETKEDYYLVLKEASAGWHQGRHDINPWWDYFLSTLRLGYRELAERVERSGSMGGKTQLIEQAILSQSDPFTLSDIQNLHPSVSLQLVKKILARIKREGKIRLEGKGRGAKWMKN